MAKKIKPIKTVYTIYDTDDFAVCKCVYQEETLLECWRKLSDGSEFNLFEQNFRFAFTCSLEGDRCKKEFYDEYGKDFYGFTNKDIDKFRDNLGMILRRMKDVSGRPLMDEREVCSYMYYSNESLASIMRYHAPESWADMITM